MRIYFKLNTSWKTNFKYFYCNNKTGIEFLICTLISMKPVSTTMTLRYGNTQYNGSGGKLKPVRCVTHFTAWTPNVNAHMRTGQTMGLQCTYVGFFTFNYNQNRSDLITTLSPNFSILCSSKSRKLSSFGKNFSVPGRPCSVL